MKARANSAASISQGLPGFSRVAEILPDLIARRMVVLSRSTSLAAWVMVKATHCTPMHHTAMQCIHPTGRTAAGMIAAKPAGWQISARQPRHLFVTTPSFSSTYAVPDFSLVLVPPKIRKIAPAPSFRSVYVYFQTSASS